MLKSKPQRLTGTESPPAVKPRHAGADTSGTMTPSSRPKRVARWIHTLLNPAARLSQERGASAVEYAILLAGIAAVCVAVMAALGVSVQDLFSRFVDTLHSL